jgi:hypothetical protein
MGVLDANLASPTNSTAELSGSIGTHVPVRIVCDCQNSKPRLSIQLLLHHFNAPPPHTATGNAVLKLVTLLLVLARSAPVIGMSLYCITAD